MFQVARSCKYILGYDFWSYLLICKSDRCLIFDGCCLGMVDYQETYNWEISQTLPEDFWVFRARTLPEHKMLQCLVWSNDLAIIQYKVHQRTSTYINVPHSVTQCHGWVEKQYNSLAMRWALDRPRSWSIKMDQKSESNPPKFGSKKKRHIGAGPRTLRTWCAWSAWTSSVASRSSSKKHVVQNSSFFFTHKLINQQKM